MALEQQTALQTMQTNQASRGTSTVLLVEDDPALTLGLSDSLAFEGFEVVHAATGQEAIALAQQHTPDCILLDVMLPDMNGYQVCETVRQDNDRVPILMLTARSQEADKIRGLEVGADDYVTKPFSVGELMARVRALLRRTRRSEELPMTPFCIGACEIDPAAQTLHKNNTHNTTEQLSFHETQLLAYLHRRRGQPVSRDDILKRVWECQASYRTIDNVIVRLRRYIEPQPETPQYILTVYGVGYRLAMPDADGEY